MRCSGAGSADRVFLLLLKERGCMESRGVGGKFGPVWGRGAVPVGQALGCVAQDCQGLGDRVLIMGVKTDGLGW